MNKVFKVIWNHATQTWTAVSELGHAKGKTKSKKIVKLTALAGAVIGVMGTAQAAVDTSKSTITIKSDAPGNVAGTGQGDSNINIGTGANTYRLENGKVSNNAIAIGTNAAGTGDKSVAIGKDSSAKVENGIAIGFTATNESIDSVAIGTRAKSSKDMDVAIGKEAQATGGESLAFGSQSKASGQATIAVGKESNASGSSAVAAGYQSAAAGDNAVAVGKNTTAGASNAIAVGLRATATGTRAIATGAGSSATGEQSLANGFTAKASGNDSIALGNAANASAANATAIGTGAVASDNNAVALGAGSTTKGAIAYQSDTFFGKRYVFAGGSPSSVVSIGSDGKERQLVNVAAGRINGQSTDAVNGSQLYAVADAVSNHHWVIGGNTTAKNTDVAPVKLDYSDVKNADIVEFQNGKGTTATVENTPADKSSGRAAKTIVKYNANIVSGDNTEVVYNSDGSVKINAKVAGGTDTTAAVTTTTTDALTVTNTTTGNVTTYNVDAKTGSISTTPVGAATYAKDGDKATGGNYGSRLTNVSTVTDIVNNVSWHLNSSAVTGTNGKITEGSDTEAADVKASNTVNINAGKNIEIKRNGTTIEISSTAGEKGEKGDTGATGAKGDTGAAGAKGDTGATGAAGAKGDTGATGADGKNAEADVKDNGDGTHTVTIKDGNGNTTTTIIKDGATGAKGDTGADGKNAEADVKDNGDGTHTVTIKDGNGNTTTTIIKDGATGAKGEKGDTGATGADGKNAEADVKDNGDGTHTVTIKDGNGNTTTTIVKDGKDGATGATGATGADGKNAEADVKDNGDGTHTVTIKDGNGNTTTTIVKDGKDGKDGVMTWDIKSTGNTTEGSADTAKTIKHTNTVDMAAGKNLTVNQTNNSDGAKVEFALNSTVTNLDKVVVNGKDGVDGKDGVTITAPVEAKDGKDGSDGKVGISGKDGKDAVSISGKDGVGQIGLTGPKGKDGKDGASINITTDNGKQTLVNREVGADGKPGETTQRIIYVPTDKDGNPLKDENGNTIKREVATMDDGLIFGGNTGEAHKAALGTQVNVKGATTNTDWNKFDAGKNIMTQVNGDTITVGLAKDLEVDNVDVNNNVTAKGTISAPTFKAGDTTINNGVVTNLTHHIDNPTTVVDDKVLNITDEKKKEAATVRDVLNSGWNLQANGKPVDAVTHGNNVNFASDKGTVTVKANSDGKTSVVNLDVNVDNDTITVNNKGQLVANGATNFNVATKDGGNKVAKKGGSSTAKITSGKTITYTAGKNIAIEQNGGEILVSTTNDVDHNSVTTNNLTVNKGGNIDMGGNQIHNVKAGTKDTDAVNVSQLKQSIGDVHKRINKVGKEARGGIAGANAAAGLPQVYIPGKSMVAASAGTFKGESAVAVGYSRSSDNGKVIFKLQGNANTQGDVGGSVGVGYQW